MFYLTITINITNNYTHMKRLSSLACVSFIFYVQCMYFWCVERVPNLEHDRQIIAVGKHLCGAATGECRRLIWMFISRWTALKIKLKYLPFLPRWKKKLLNAHVNVISFYMNILYTNMSLIVKWQSTPIVDSWYLLFFITIISQHQHMIRMSLQNTS